MNICKRFKWILMLFPQKLDIILDFVIIEESLNIKFYNRSKHKFVNVRTEFSNPIIGLNGEKVISELNVFKHLQFMAPGKEFLIYVDELNPFFANNKNELITVLIYATKRNGKQVHKKIEHNLNIYKDIIIKYKPS